ncbi:class I SAM-dependent methyltransferase [Paenibacillus sp. Leaf72]|uniref:class I SAM-dependent methyltransferase n=1 Tax=Paenibacillus sp. Leaf72 TaxID=1736234 RepID=UPI0006FD1C30|nr:class I SAM-dependent methyltransferase [Paenibacillus sp. Leaf72]KQO18430.1 methyltransferase type 11 [Paenibacillus sp. Leaf72]
MSSNQVWQSDHYDRNLGFVSELGKDVVRLLNPMKDEKIFDLGCGTGDLAHEISQAGAHVTGMDLSEAMIEQAQHKYPKIQFFVGDGEHFTVNSTFDAVFSNAALHWMKNPGAVLTGVWNSLSPGGRFVAEFGGKGNVETIVQAIGEVLHEEFGMDAGKLNPWYFPSIAEYSALLEQQGFRVTYAAHFDRPTKIKDNEQGLNHWLRGFADNFFKALFEEERTAVCSKIAAKARNELFHDGSWYADYKRLRVMAIKPE